VFVNLTKAYDWVNWQALWCILRTNRVPSKIIELLENLHIGTFATIRLRAKSFSSVVGCDRVALWHRFCSMYSLTLWLGMPLTSCGQISGYRCSFELMATCFTLCRLVRAFRCTKLPCYFMQTTWSCFPPTHKTQY